MLQLASGCDLLVDEAARERVAGHLLEVTDRADRGDVTPRRLDRLEAGAQELVGDVREDAGQAHRAEAGRLHVGERELKEALEVAAPEAAVTVRLREDQQRLAEAQAVPILPAGGVERALAELCFERLRLQASGDAQRGLDDRALDALALRTRSTDTLVGPPEAHDLELVLVGLPARFEGGVGEPAEIVGQFRALGEHLGRHGLDALPAFGLGPGASSDLIDLGGRVAGGDGAVPLRRRRCARSGIVSLAVVGGGHVRVGASGSGVVRHGLRLLVVLGGDPGLRLLVRAEIDEADFVESGLVRDVDGAVELPAVDRDGDVALDELELVHGSADRRLPREALLAAGHDLLRRSGVARDDTVGHELAVLDSDALGVADALERRVLEPDRPALRRDLHPVEVDDHRISEAERADRATGVGDHGEPRERALARVVWRRGRGFDRDFAVDREDVGDISLLCHRPRPSFLRGQRRRSCWRGSGIRGARCRALP